MQEEDFACLYSEIDSRPNVPVNCIVSAILLQHKHRECMFKKNKDIQAAKL